mmetsp:Transcript_21644/g.31051  ORF Transcript_21644/g.31051 Transcript_21644/m.31051 type:complete len:94 (-) Transcript_21644:665-946(-)
MSAMMDYLATDQLHATKYEVIREKRLLFSACHFVIAFLLENPPPRRQREHPLTKRATVSLSPPLLAISKGVRPCWSADPERAPAARRRSTTSE